MGRGWYWVSSFRVKVCLSIWGSYYSLRGKHKGSMCFSSAFSLFDQRAGALISLNSLQLAFTLYGCLTKFFYSFPPPRPFSFFLQTRFLSSGWMSFQVFRWEAASLKHSPAIGHYSNRNKAISCGWRNVSPGWRLLSYWEGVNRDSVQVWIHAYLLCDLGKSPYPLWATFLPSVQSGVWIWLMISISKNTLEPFIKLKSIQR